MLLNLQPYYADNETLEERTARYTTIAVAIEQAVDRATCKDQPEDCKPIWNGNPERLAAITMMKGYQESRFALHIQNNQCRKGYWSDKQGKWIPGECDEKVYRDVHNNVIGRKFTSLTNWQLKYSPLIKDEWNAGMFGTSQEETNRAAWAAVKTFAAHKARCKTDLGAISGYAGKSNCRWDQAQKRLAFAKRLERDLGRAARGELKPPQVEKVAARN